MQSRGEFVTVRAIIAADPTGIIGVNNALPWRYKADMARFKALTSNSTVIMGRKTFESIPQPKSGPMLPTRLVYVITRDIARVTSDRPDYVATTIENAIHAAHTAERTGAGSGQIWIIGGAQIYVQAVEKGYVEEIDYTVVPAVESIPDGAEVTRLPETFLNGFDLVSETPNSDDPQLTHRLYRRCSLPQSS